MSKVRLDKRLNLEPLIKVLSIVKVGLMLVFFSFMAIPLTGQVVQNGAKSREETPNCKVQQFNEGIRWEVNLSWEQIKAKANLEGKLIFVDCYTTWCQPCKMMDQEVFRRADIGQFFKEHFISIRLQMDKTRQDSKEVREWYAAADQFRTEYVITAYPTFLFLNHEGKLVHRSEGFVSASGFVELGRIALLPGQSYENPHVKFNLALKYFKDGQMDFDSFPSLINAASRLGKSQLKDSLIDCYFHYIRKDTQAIYKKSHLNFLSTLVNSSHPFFRIFYPGRYMVDSIMGDKNYSRFVVLKVIENEYIKPFIDSTIKSMSYRKVKEEKLEPNWNSFYEKVYLIFGRDYAIRAVRMAKRKFYFTSRNVDECIKILKEQLENQDLDTTDENVLTYMNADAWNAFLYSTEKEVISDAVQISYLLVQRAGNLYGFHHILDTYANLVYKLSYLYGIKTLDREELLRLQTLAIEGAVMKQESEVYVEKFKQRLRCMESNVPTWP